MPPRPACREVQRGTEPTPPDERRWLEEAVERRRRIVTRRNDHCLFLERSARHELAIHNVGTHQAEAVLATDAPNALGVVVPLVAALVVEERREAQAVVEEIEPWLDRCQ